MRIFITYILIILIFLKFSQLVSAQGNPSLMWIQNDTTQLKKDTYVGFRGNFELSKDAEIEVKILGASWFNTWMDESFITEGPSRFPKEFPEYEVLKMKLSAGRHILASLLHYEGLTTRLMKDMPPFLYCEISTNGITIPVEWSCKQFGGFWPELRRINPQLGWIEWSDTKEIPEDWKRISFKASDWTKPVNQKIILGKLQPLSTGSVLHPIKNIHPIKTGPLAENYGYEADDISARFFLRDQECKDNPAQGIWKRYDLGKVSLFHPKFVLDLPKDAEVQFAYSEELDHGRVAPYINLSAGSSCNLDRFLARGGKQEFFTHTPKAGRYMEIHIIGDTSRIKFLDESVMLRTYYDEPDGAFNSNDILLNKIWMTGIETYRSCSEDALVDNPTRERGQWTGDVVSVGMDIGMAGYSDIRLIRRGLIQAAQCNQDGLIAGLSPGGPTYPLTYAIQWISACNHYWQLTGEKQLLEKLYPYAIKNLDVFEKHLIGDALKSDWEWSFVDWGYIQKNPTDLGLNLHYLIALEDMVSWCNALNKKEDANRFIKLKERIKGNISKEIISRLGKDGQKIWNNLGYHSTALALKANLISVRDIPEAIAFLKKHMLQCFPNNPSAARLSGPSVQESMLITPYFAHFAMPVLIENGEMNFVLDQYRSCWGWALKDGRTTWVEVFDTRWSQCHQWSGAPTWQLSRYALGLHPRNDWGKDHYDLKLFTGDLKEASGKVPMAGEKKAIEVKWKKAGNKISYKIQTPRPVYLHYKNKIITIKKNLEMNLSD